MKPNKPQTQAKLSAFASMDDEVKAPEYIEEPLHTYATGETFNRLRQLDLAFTDDDTRFMGHDLHPYPAKFIPQLPGTFVSLLSSRGELVFDPFGGSGTTALESIRLGRRAISTDANPMAALIGKVKTARVAPESAAELHLMHGLLRGMLDTLPADPTEFAEKYRTYAPTIANQEKWFADSAFGELAHIKYRIGQLTTQTAKDIGLLALSRTVLSASFQDSETRYKSVPRHVPVGETTKRYIKEFESVMRSVAKNAPATRYGISSFITSDVRELSANEIPDNSVDLVMTSPPYGNATDYHLYHRFRLLWLGFDPIALGKVEIGSHLKHQRESSGFESYFGDMLQTLAGIGRVLKHGRYAVLVIGDSVYKGVTYDTAHLLAERSAEFGFESSCVIERALHKTKRSFSAAGRRAAAESILILRKAAHPALVTLHPPPYKLWPYEKLLRKGECGEGDELGYHLKFDLPVTKSVNITDLSRARNHVFTHQIEYADGHKEWTWQAILENSSAPQTAGRKDPKYVTHGIHPYKGKFYPQLAKGLMNQLELRPGSKVLDPFCGSGTTLLEGHLNGFATYGCDLNPLAAQIARTKSSIIGIDPDLLTEVVSAIVETIDTAPEQYPELLDQFPIECIDEISRWFAAPVARKMNWLLKVIRTGSDGAIREFLEVVFSSIIREVSHQEPTDLRIRYRRELLEDADVFLIFKEQLEIQFARIEKFWNARGFAPHRFLDSTAVHGDNRLTSTYDLLGLCDESVDLVLTSPPYAMALPYIDTDRLSLLVLFGMNGSERRPIEQTLIGSREINVGARRVLEQDLLTGDSLPVECLTFVRELYDQLERSSDAGFRKRNMPALMHRFLLDMNAVLGQIYRLCKPGAMAMIVIGDSKMTIDDEEIRIPSTDLIEIIGAARGFTPLERIDISVTTENYVHIKNAITENAVLRLQK